MQYDNGDAWPFRPEVPQAVPVSRNGKGGDIRNGRLLYRLCMGGTWYSPRGLYTIRTDEKLPMVDQCQWMDQEHILYGETLIKAIKKSKEQPDKNSRWRVFKTEIIHGAERIRTWWIGYKILEW